MNRSNLLQKLLPIVIIILLNVGCADKKDKAWDDIVEYINTKDLTMANVRIRFSEKAIHQMIPFGTADSIAQMKKVINNLNDHGRYKIERNGRGIHISFKEDQPNVGAPAFEITTDERGAWKVQDISLSKY